MIALRLQLMKETLAFNFSKVERIWIERCEDLEGKHAKADDSVFMNAIVKVKWAICRDDLEDE